MTKIEEEKEEQPGPGLKETDALKEARDKYIRVRSSMDSGI